MTDDDSARGDRDDYARSLRALRTKAGLTQTALAETLGVSQPMVARVEKAGRLLDVETTRRWCETCRASQRETRYLVSLATALSREYVDSRVVAQRGGGPLSFQDRIRRYETAAETVRAYQPAMVLGQLQTAAYAAAVFGARPGRDPVEVAELVASRRARSAQITDDRRRRWLLILTEGALTWCVRDHGLMAEQVEHIAVVSRETNVELGIIPAYTPAPVLAPHGFHVYDDTAAVVGTKTTTVLHDGPDDVRTYLGLFETLRGLAVFGGEARAVLSRLAGEYRARHGAVSR